MNEDTFVLRYFIHPLGNFIEGDIDGIWENSQLFNFFRSPGIDNIGVGQFAEYRFSEFLNRNLAFAQLANPGDFVCKNGPCSIFPPEVTQPW